MMITRLRWLRRFGAILVLCAPASLGWRVVEPVHGQVRPSVPSAPRAPGLQAGSPARQPRWGAETRGVPFDADWRFSRGDFANAALPAFDDKTWRRVELPHDWSAEGPFDAGLGSGNGYAPAGVAWYRKHFILPRELAAMDGAIEFDGVYDHAEVWVNGQFVGGRPYGYSSFECPLTPYVKFSGADNVVAIRVDHSRFADSRWYTGSGIYRHVRLRFTNALRIARWGTFVTTPAVSAASATVRVATNLENRSSLPRTFVLESDVLDGEAVVASAMTSRSLEPGDDEQLVQQVTVPRPGRWSPDSPVLYVLRQRVREGAEVIDEARTPFGIRTIRFDPDRGFFLNEMPVKLKGVCVHHDAGSLGAAVPEAVWERRLRALKALGVNAIRTSHNPPAPEFLELCDHLGLLVQDEAFDEFTPPKNKWVSGRNVGVPSRFGYGEIFAEWSVTDVSDMVRRDRNHPSIVMWSIGNEIDYPNDPFTHEVLGKSYRAGNPAAQNLVRWARPLVDAVRKLDRTRPITAGLASLVMSDEVGLPGLLDVVGYNYQESRYAEDHARYPRRVIFGSENGHQLSNWTVVRDQPYVAGQFLWTGIDYLGEAGVFPNRANGAGLLDLCAFKKPAAWFRQSLWSDTPMVYLSASAAGAARGRGARVEEHWNWKADSTVTVSCYTNCQEVALTLNDKPVGTKRASEAIDGVLTWDVPYSPGVLKAVGRIDGKVVAEFTLTTAGQAARIELLPDVTRIGADGICHVEFRIVDARGVRVPDAGALVTFTVEGPARVLGIGNANLSSIEDDKDLAHRACQGRGLVILQATSAAGPVTLRASAPGLEAAVVTMAR